MYQVAFEKNTLSNGLDVILHEDHTLPLVSVNIWYHVGSKDEEPGKTGYAHLFEHLMFEGSKNHNSSFFEPLTEVGAALNGSTSVDRTNYWENVPSNYLELALWLESDRMGFLLDALDQPRFDVQRDVVKNERRQSYENRPYGMAGLRIQEALYPAPHPYHWPTIGYHEDLDVAKLEDAHSFFRQYYTPSNASLTIAGDFDPKHAMDLVKRYFEDIPPGEGLRRTNRTDSSLQGRVELTLYDRVLVPRIFLAWPTVPKFHQDEAPLAILADILGNGKTSRLYRSLVYTKQAAQRVAAHHDDQEIAGDFSIDVTASEGRSCSEIEEIVQRELERACSQPPTSEEMTRSKNRVEWHHTRQMASIGGFGGRANRLNSFNVLAGDPDRINRDMERYLSVESEDVMRVANTYLGEDQVRLTVMPEPQHSSSSSLVDRTVKPDPAPQPRFEPPAPQRHKLANDMNLLVVRKPEIPMIALGVVLGTGSVDDPAALPGLASITSTLLQEGTTSRSSEDIANEFEFFGSQLSISTGKEHTMIGAECLAREFPRALELVADVLLNPIFPDGEVERVRNERLTSVRRLKDDPTAMADLLAPALMYGRDSALGHPAAGLAGTFETIGRDHVAGHYASAFSPGIATLIVVGDTTPEEALALAEERFGHWRGSESGGDGSSKLSDSPSSGRPSLYLLDKPGAAQSVIRVGYFTTQRRHPDYYAYALFNHLFGGQFTARLNKNLRQDKGYSYGYRSWFEWHRDSSLFLAGGAVQTEVTAEALKETIKELDEVKGARPITQEEHRIAQEGLLRQYPSAFESCGQIMQQLAQITWYGLPDDYCRNFSGNLSAVSLEDVNRVAAEQMGKEPTIVVVGDKAVVGDGLSSFGRDVREVDHEARYI